MWHPDEGLIHEWIDGAASEQDAARLEAHLAECDSCSALVAEARGYVAAASRIASALDWVAADVIPAGKPASGVAASRTGHTPGRALPSFWRSTPLRVAASIVLVAGISSVLVRDVIRSGKLDEIKGEAGTRLPPSTPALPGVAEPVPSNVGPGAAPGTSVPDSTGAATVGRVGGALPAREERVLDRAAADSVVANTAGADTSARNRAAPPDSGTALARTAVPPPAVQATGAAPPPDSAGRAAAGAARGGSAVAGRGGGRGGRGGAGRGGAGRGGGGGARGGGGAVTSPPPTALSAATATMQTGDSAAARAVLTAMGTAPGTGYDSLLRNLISPPPESVLRWDRESPITLPVPEQRELESSSSGCMTLGFVPTTLDASARQTLGALPRGVRLDTAATPDTSAARLLQERQSQFEVLSRLGPQGWRVVSRDTIEVRLVVNAVTVLLRLRSTDSLLTGVAVADRDGQVQAIGNVVAQRSECQR